MTREDHPNGTSRIAEVVAGINASVEVEPTEKPIDNKEEKDREEKEKKEGRIIVNVQGDEPQIEPGVIDELIEALAAEPHPGGAPMATLASEFAPDEDPNDPNIVKLVVANVDGRLRAMYFSRSLIPFDRDPHTPSESKATPLKHPGLYAYRSDFLLKYVQLGPTPLEQTEKLEQLRALEHGYPIAVVKTHVRHHGIDTPQQYEAFVRQYGDNH